MRLYYDVTGKIYYAVWDYMLLGFSHSTHIELFEFDIDPIAENAELMIDLQKTILLRDEDGNGKYYIENGQLYERENWTPVIL